MEMAQVGGVPGKVAFVPPVVDPAIGNRHLRRLYETEIIIVHSTDGTETFMGSGVFLGGVYGETIPFDGKPTLMKNAAVYEIARDGKFPDFFENFGVGRRQWTQSQVVIFCRYRRNKLRSHEFANLFELEGGLVADVNIDQHTQLCVHTFLPNYNGTWRAKYQHRVISLL